MWKCWRVCCRIFKERVKFCGKTADISGCGSRSFFFFVEGQLNKLETNNIWGACYWVGVFPELFQKKVFRERGMGIQRESKREYGIRLHTCIGKKYILKLPADRCEGMFLVAKQTSNCNFFVTKTQGRCPTYNSFYIFHVPYMSIITNNITHMLPQLNIAQFFL